MVQSLERAKEALASLPEHEGKPAADSDEGLVIEPEALPPARPELPAPSPAKSEPGTSVAPPVAYPPRPQRPPPPTDRGPKPTKKPGVDDPGF